MLLEFLPPPPQLAPYVSIFFRYRNGERLVRGIERADIGQIRFMLCGAGAVRFADGRTDRSSDITVLGPTCGAYSYRVDGGCHVFGFSLRPIGWGAIVGLPAHECADRLTDGGSLLGEEGAAVIPDLCEADDLAAMVERVAPLLMARIAENAIPRMHWQLAEAVRRWLIAEGAIEVADLFAALPWSSRQTTRLVNHYFGGPPKFLARKFRALRAACAILGGQNPAEVASAFYDQSHMIKEVRHFTGRTPGELSGNKDPFVAMTLNESTFNELAPVLAPVPGNAQLAPDERLKTGS